MLNKLRIAQQDVLEAHKANPLVVAVEAERAPTTLRFQKNAQNWIDGLALSSLTSDLQSHVSYAQCLTQEAVFARKLTAYKLAASCFLDGKLQLTSPLDCTTRFYLGHKVINQSGFLVTMTPAEAEETLLDPDFDQRCVQLVILRVIVSGCGARIGKQYLFPELTPIAVQQLVSNHAGQHSVV